MTEDNQKFDIIILGNGICAQSILFEIGKSEEFDLDTLKIAHVFNDEFCSPCSVNSTSVVSLSGTSKGISPLGDLIVDSFNYTLQLAKGELQSEFHLSKQYYIYEEGKDKDQFIKRYKTLEEVSLFDKSFLGSVDECFVVDNEALLQKLEQSNLKLKITKFNKTIIDISVDGTISLLDGSKVRGKKVVSALGAYSNHFLKNFKHTHLDHSKLVPGDYLLFKDVDLGSESFVITKGHYNLVYRAFSKTTLIGGTTLKDEWCAIDYVELRPLYNYFKELISVLPDFHEGEIRTGLRHKGKKRLPFLGEVAPSIYSFHGVYKNGFTFSFYMANNFVRNFNV
ncbi:FAD-dependent oxidoreductase [Halobacteriovorax sp. JY17]|uniref:FAD-dependent oxidoreductase n=1 Tax=Halobacteriovorax sp. JY17 TaxID=2014617 RepID=UPI000C65A5CD|nr:FAD-dependent oxidoreductase [Halobacteriovorax sp. JY17]PIK15774.1 MAG: hypothetical protein CES88_03335 [Halobacteriovorax sp. JY17]